MIFRPRGSSRVPSVIFSFGAFSVLFMPWRISSVFFMPSQLDALEQERILDSVPDACTDDYRPSCWLSPDELEDLGKEKMVSLKILDWKNARVVAWRTKFGGN